MEPQSFHFNTKYKDLTFPFYPFGSINHAVCFFFSFSGACDKQNDYNLITSICLIQYSKITKTNTH